MTFVGRIGQDLFAPLALGIWQQEGINTDYVVQDPEHAAGVAAIFVDETSENSIVVVLGANLNVSKEDVDAAAGAIAQADIVLTQLEINYDTVGYVLELAKRLSGDHEVFGDGSVMIIAAPGHTPGHQGAKRRDFTFAEVH